MPARLKHPDLEVGQRFRLWTVVEVGLVVNKNRAARVRCRCGIERVHTATYLWNPPKKGGGCYACVRPTFNERLASRFIPEPNTGCWLWLGNIDRMGYGKILLKNRNLFAHRAMFEMENGPIPPGLCALHRCDNPPCVNPRHLFLGTRTENMRDKVRKGRQGKKLTEALAREIYAAMVAGEPSKDVAKRFGLSRDAPVNILSGRTWGLATGAARRADSIP